MGALENTTPDAPDLERITSEEILEPPRVDSMIGRYMVVIEKPCECDNKVDQGQ